MEDAEQVVGVLVDLRPLALRQDVLDVERVPAEALGKLHCDLVAGGVEADPGEAVGGELSRLAARGDDRLSARVRWRGSLMRGRLGIGTERVVHRHWPIRHGTREALLRHVLRLVRHSTLKEGRPPISVSWRAAGRLYASGTVLGRTGRSQEGGQRREASPKRGPAAQGSPAREARCARQELNLRPRAPEARALSPELLALVQPV